jgi:hypothetical protein
MMKSSALFERKRQIRVLCSMKEYIPSRLNTPHALDSCDTCYLKAPPAKSTQSNFYASPIKSAWPLERGERLAVQRTKAAPQHADLRDEYRGTIAESQTDEEEEDSWNSRLVAGAEVEVRW